MGKELTVALKCTQVQDNAALQGKYIFSRMLPGESQAQPARGQRKQPRAGAGRAVEAERKSLAAGWEDNCGISLPHPTVEPRVVEMKVFCLRIPK